MGRPDAYVLVTPCFFMLRHEVPYKELGAKHFDRHDTVGSDHPVHLQARARKWGGAECSPSGNLFLWERRFGILTAQRIISYADDIWTSAPKDRLAFS